MKKEFKKLLFTFMLMLAFIIGSVNVTNAACAFPSVSSSTYLEMIAFRSANVYTTSDLSTRGTSSPKKNYNASISTGDTVYVYKLTTSYCYVSYPVGSTRKLGYCKTGQLLGTTQAQTYIKAKSGCTVYRTPTGSSYGSIEANDDVYTGGKTGDRGFVIYSAKSGNRKWKGGWINISDASKIKNTASYNYTIKFNANGGSGVPSTITKTGTNSSVIMGDISSLVPTRSGYTFYGWSASSSWSTKRIAYDSSHGGKAAPDGTTATTTRSSWTYANYCAYSGGSESNRTLTLYAQWKANPSSGRIPITKTATVFLQKDTRWSTVKYGYSDKAGTKTAYIGQNDTKGNGSGAGCGLLAMTNAVYYLNGSFISPIDLASYSVNNGYRVNGVGTAYGLWKSFANNRGAAYGIAFVSNTTSWTSLTNYLKEGKVAICRRSGHILCIVNYDPSTDKYLLLDSYPCSSWGTSGAGKLWCTKNYLKNTVGIVDDFYVLKSTR